MNASVATAKTAQFVEVNEFQTAAEIASTYHNSLFRWAMSLCNRDSHEALEVVQQVYVEVLEGRANLLPSQNHRAFLFGVARRVASSRHRRRSIWGKILRHSPDRLPQIASAADPEDETHAGQVTLKVRAALGELSSRQQQVVTLVFMEEQTLEEAGKLMGISVGSARTHYHRAKKKLAELLGGSQ